MAQVKPISPPRVNQKNKERDFQEIAQVSPAGLRALDLNQTTRFVLEQKGLLFFR